MKKIKRTKTTYQKTGKYHIANRTDNQDAVLEAESVTAKIIVIADGVSSCLNGRQGAEIACKAVSDIMLNETSYIFSSSSEKIAGLLSAYVYKKLSEVARADNQPVESYSSTLSFVCHNKINGKTMTFLLGDSLIYMISDGEPALACKPKLLDDCKTFTTTTKNVSEAIEINVCTHTSKVRYILATDGAWGTFYSCGILSDKFEQAVKEEKIIDYLEEQQCNDDCSIIMMDIPKGA